MTAGHLADHLQEQGYASFVREAELWSRLTEQIGEARVRSWAELQALGPLGGRTVREALDDGVSCKTIWRACWEVLELPLRYK